MDDMRGYAKIYRDLLDKDFFYKPDYLAVWMHLLLRATYKKRKIVFNDNPLTLEVGDCIISQRKLSKCLGIALTKVHRIIKFFKKNGQVSTRATRKFTIISICNFESYQRSETPIEHDKNTCKTPIEHDKNTSKNKQEGKKGRREEGKNINNNTSKTSDIRQNRTSQKTLAQARLEKFEEFYNAFAYKSGRKGALKSWNKLGDKVLDDDFFNKILEGARKTAAERPIRKAKGITPKMPQGWLTGEGWNDEDFLTADDLTNKNQTVAKLSTVDQKKFEQFFKIYNLNQRKAEAEQVWLSLGDIDDELLAKIIDGAAKESAQRPHKISQGTMYRLPHNWLKGRGWEDEAAIEDNASYSIISQETHKRREVENARLKQEREEDAKAKAEEETRQKKIDALGAKGLIGLDAFIKQQGKGVIRPGTTLGRHTFINEYYKTISQ